MRDSADFLALRQHFRDIANSCRRADKLIVSIADRIDRNPVRNDPKHCREQVRAHVRGITILLHVIEARLGTEPTEQEQAADEARAAAKGYRIDQEPQS